MIISPEQATPAWLTGVLHKSRVLPRNEYSWETEVIALDVVKVDEAFLQQLAQELDALHVIALALTGSCARGEETDFSDVDINRGIQG